LEPLKENHEHSSGSDTPSHQYGEHPDRISVEERIAAQTEERERFKRLVTWIANRGDIHPPAIMDCMDTFEKKGFQMYPHRQIIMRIVHHKKQKGEILKY
jgi:hypothetical protein